MVLIITPEKLSITLKNILIKGNFETIILKQKILELFVFLNNT